MIVNFQTHASNERTFLAWVRTVVAIVGFGLAAARLNAQPASLWSEAVMLAAGAAVIVIAWARMVQLRKRIDAPGHLPDTAGLAEVLLMVLMAALFVLLAGFALHVG